MNAIEQANRLYADLTTARNRAAVLIEAARRLAVGRAIAAQTTDETEGPRRILQTVVNATAPQGDNARAKLEAQHGRVWDTDQIRLDFEVLGFLAPFMVVRRLSDGKKGSLMFQHSPRFYFSFTEDR